MYKVTILPKAITPTSYNVEATSYEWAYEYATRAMPDHVVTHINNKAVVGQCNGCSRVLMDGHECFRRPDRLFCGDCIIEELEAL